MAGGLGIFRPIFFAVSKGEAPGLDKARDAWANQLPPIFDVLAVLGREETLARLSDAQSPTDMNLPGWGLHPLHGNLANHWAVTVNGNWRMTFTFDGEDAELVDYLDYH